MIRAPPKTKRSFKRSKASPATAAYAKRNVRNQSVAARSLSLRPGYFRSHISGFPQRYVETLRWSYFASGTAGAGVYLEPLVIRANSPYDPDVAIGGSQPAAYSKLIAVYTKCYTKACRISVRITNVSGGGGAGLQPLEAGLVLTTAGTALPSLTGAIQGGLCVHKNICVNPDQVYLTQSVDMSKFFSVGDIMDGSSYYCTAASNAAQEVFAHLFLYNQGAGTAYYSYNIDVDYECVFADPTVIT